MFLNFCLSCRHGGIFKKIANSVQTNKLRKKQSCSFSNTLRNKMKRIFPRAVTQNVEMVFQDGSGFSSSILLYFLCPWLRPLLLEHQQVKPQIVHLSIIVISLSPFHHFLPLPPQHLGTYFWIFHVHSFTSFKLSIFRMIFFCTFQP